MPGSLSLDEFFLISVILLHEKKITGSFIFSIYFLILKLKTLITGSPSPLNFNTYFSKSVQLKWRLKFFNN